MANTKAFDLKLLLGRENIMGNKPKVTIEAIEMSGKNLYIGTNDGSLLHFPLLENAASHDSNDSSVNSPQLSPFLQAQKNIGTKKSIVQIKATAELNCLLINSDNCIHAYSMINLEPALFHFGKIKHVSKFYVNDNPVHANPFAVEICVTFVKKKNVQIFQLQEHNVIPFKEITFPEHPRVLALDGRHMCVGTDSRYVMVDIDSNHRQDLFPANRNKLFVCKVAPAEFLLAAPNALGVFVTSAGISQRAPIQWSEDIFQACFVHPYVVGMDNEFITVHSVIDQQKKQTLPFQGGTKLFQSIERLLVCTPKDVFVLLLIPYSKQISNLLCQEKVEEAMNLAKACCKLMSHDEYEDMMLITYRKAGFVHFMQMDFDSADEMFTKGHIDIREVICLYDGILPADSNFVRFFPPYHNIANVNQLCGDVTTKLEEYEGFLVSYLETHPLHPVMGDTDATESLFDSPRSGFRSDVFLSSLKLFSKLHKTKLILHMLQQQVPDTCDKPVGTPLFYEFKSYASEISQVLDGNGCFHAEAVNFLLNDNMDEAMSLWKELVTGDKVDVDFPGLMFVATCLGRYCRDLRLLWKHAEWILEADQCVGVSIFTDNLHHDEWLNASHNSETLGMPKIDDVISFLHHHHVSLRIYLEHLVFLHKVPKEKFHSHLTVLYLEDVLALKDQENRGEEFTAARMKFQKLLKMSSIYRISLILGKVRENGLLTESVILHAKLGEHEKALDILVSDMCEQNLAEEYCVAQGADHEQRARLFEHLLKIYLSKISAGIGEPKGTQSAISAVKLLNRYAEYYDAQGILERLPKSWSIALLSQFLSRNIRLRMHSMQTSLLQLMLERSVKNNLRTEHVDLGNMNVSLTEDKICQACNQLMRNADCAVYPNGVFVHLRCGDNKHVCPVTGRLFNILPLPKH